MDRNKSRQLSLLSGAEDSYARRESDLAAALDAAKCDLHLRVFVEKVFYLTHGGVSGEMTKSYAEIAARPNWLCCGVSTAQRTVEKALDLGLVAGTRRRYASGSQRPNAYTIDWAGVRALADLKRTSTHARATDVQNEQGPSQIEQGPSHFEQGPVQNEHRIKEYNTSSTSSLNTIRTGPEKAGPQPTEKSADTEQLPTVPELTEAQSRTIAPLPPGEVAYGAFKPITEELLKRPDKVLTWFRQALGVPTPVCSATEAHLLLVLAAARCAVDMPQRDVLKTRSAFFASTVSRRKWQRVLCGVPEARRQLDGLLERHGRVILEGPLPTAKSEVPA